MSCETCTHAHEFMSTSVYESATPQFTAGACSRGSSHTSNVSNVDYQLSFIKLSGISMEELKGLSASTTCRTVSLCLTGTSLRTSGEDLEVQMEDSEGQVEVAADLCLPPQMYPLERLH